MIPRVGEAVKPGVRYGRREGQYAIIAEGRDLLLTFQQAPVPEVQLPGGGVDPGESALRALHREVFEETGWRIAPERRLGAFRRFTYMPEYDRWAEKLCHVWLARPVICHGPPREPGHTALWMPAEAALEALGNAGDRLLLARWLGAAAPAWPRRRRRGG